MKKPLVDLMLDSGAFSAWLHDRTIPVKDYGKYLLEWKDLLHSYVSLDFIPGKHGRTRTEAEVQYAGKTSYSNHQELKAMGLSPIPVFHQGEEWKWLERYIDDGEPYIGISAFKDVPASSQRKWLDEAFTVLTNKDGNPVCKVHGFAITNIPFLLRYPFHTCDSTTWSLGAGYGQIPVPPLKSHEKSEFNWTGTPIRYVFSGVQQKNASGNNKQLEAQRDKAYGAVKRFLEEECGITVTEARYDTNARRRAFLIYYMRLVEHLHLARFEHRQHEHATKHPVALKKKAITFPHPFIMFASTIKNRTWAKLMTDVGANTRLVSYWETRERAGEEFEHFIETGTCLAPTRTNKRNNDVGRLFYSEGYLNARRLRLAERVEENEQVDLHART